MVSTVSTRGIKFKFSEGERVLCYEPDPTKAKVLYESKVLELVVSRDERGRKVPEYLIHFFGWNNSWDRCVREEFILPYTEENSELQIKLASDAALTIKGKRKMKLPPLIKETLAKQQCSEAEKLKIEKEEQSDSSSESNSSEDESEQDIIIDIPEVLKKQLEEDFKNITKKDKFVKLPCKPNVIAILEAYVKHMAAKLLCASPPKNAKNGNQLMPEDVKNKLNLCKEATDGIRVYFDFTLPHLLLYRQEKKQHYTTGINCAPISSSYYWEPKESIDSVVVKVEKLENEISSNELKCISNTSAIKVELKNVLSNRPRNRKSPRSQTVKLSPPCKQNNTTNGEIENKTENVEKTKKEEKTKKTSPKESSKYTTTRVLRSSEKHKTVPPKEDVTPKNPINTSPVLPNAKRHRSASPISSLSTTDPISPPRVTRKSTLQNMSPPRISSPTLSNQSLQSQVEEKSVPTTSASNHNRGASLPLPSNCISSSNSSSHSTFSTHNIKHKFHLINNEALLQEILSWRLVPQHLYDCIPAAPSLIYGPQHLLRLFVKLPELLSKMSISKKKMAPLLDILHSLMLFIVEKRNELFHPSAYIDACDEEPMKNVSSSK